MTRQLEIGKLFRVAFTGVATILHRVDGESYLSLWCLVRPNIVMANTENVVGNSSSRHANRVVLAEMFQALTMPMLVVSVAVKLRHKKSLRLCICLFSI